jgi:hypothetical protein
MHTKSQLTSNKKILSFANEVPIFQTAGTHTQSRIQLLYLFTPHLFIVNWHTPPRSTDTYAGMCDNYIGRPVIIQTLIATCIDKTGYIYYTGERSLRCSTFSRHHWLARVPNDILMSEHGKCQMSYAPRPLFRSLNSV